eukprot:309089_1
MKHLFCGILYIVCYFICYCDSQSLLDPRCYNYYFYVNTNPNVIQQQIYTKQQAQNHWLQYGINKGLQGCGSFHVLQFLDNYPPLKQKFGTNYSAAINYYLTTGYNQGLMGYTPGGAYNRYTIAEIPTHLYVSASNRMAGAIDSIVFKNIEYVNAWNHGRNLQISISINNNGPCFNPNEAGSQNDNQTNQSTSILKNISSNNNTLITSNVPAFWLSTGDECAINKVNISMFDIEKNVKINFGYQGMWWITYKFNVTVPMDINELIIESPMLYVNDFLNTFWWEDGDGGVYPVNVSNNMGGNYTSSGNFNLIAASEDANMAITLVPSNMPDQSLQFKIENLLGLEQELQKTVKLSAIQKYYNISAQSVLSFETFICVGTVMDVQFCQGFVR